MAIRTIKLVVLVTTVALVGSRSWGAMVPFRGSGKGSWLGGVVLVPNIGGVHHIALTVRDLSHSKAWYGRVLGLSDLFEGDDDEVSFVVLTDSSSQLMLGLRQYQEGSGDRFDEFRTGLDHLAFAVSDKAQLQAWKARFDELGVDHSPIKDSPIGQVLTLRDPNNIQLELVARPEQ